MNFVVAVGSMVHGSITGFFQWYGWLAGTGLARWRRRTRQTDSQESFWSSPAWPLARPRDRMTTRDPAAACTPQFSASRELSERPRGA